MSHTNEVQLVANEGWDERIVICRNGELVDTFIVVTTHYVILVDTMINAQTAGALLEQARPYLAGGRCLLVVNTHADYDHCWGNQVFVGSSAIHQAPVIAGNLTAERFRQPDMAATLKQMQEQEQDIFGEVVLTRPTVLFDERLVIDGGDLTLELFATPGHTPDHTSIYIPEINTLLAADGAEMPFPFPRTTDGLPHMRRSLARMAALKPDVVLYCHAPVTIGPQLLHDNIRYFDKLEEHCRAALARGIPATPDEDAHVAGLIGLSYEEATPSDQMWQTVHEFYRSRGHAMQIRTMLEWLA